jgi:hypothetical protein
MCTMIHIPTYHQSSVLSNVSRYPLGPGARDAILLDPQDPPNHLGHPSETGQDHEKRMGSPASRVILAILAQSYPACPQEPD